MNLLVKLAFCALGYAVIALDNFMHSRFHITFEQLVDFQMVVENQSSLHNAMIYVRKHTLLAFSFAEALICDKRFQHC